MVIEDNVIAIGIDVGGYSNANFVIVLKAYEVNFGFCFEL